MIDDMGVTHSFMIPLKQAPPHQYTPKPRKHKKSRAVDTELINPVESTDNKTVNTRNIKVDEERNTTKVFERYVEKK